MVPAQVGDDPTWTNARSYKSVAAERQLGAGFVSSRQTYLDLSARRSEPPYFGNFRKFNS